MATVYSLICWGGKDGKSVTVSSTTDLVTLTNHGLRNAKGVAFVSGTLPTVSGTALALNTTYYAKNISTSTFELYYESSLTTKINFTSNGSSLVLKGAYYQALSDKSRWTTGTERIYDGLTAWNTGRSGASAFDHEIAELGENFDDIISNAGLTINIPSAATTITSLVDGVRSTAYHAGLLDEGFVVRRLDGSGGGTCLAMSKPRSTVDGFSVRMLGSNYNPNGLDLSNVLSSAYRMILMGRGGSTNGTGMSIGAATSVAQHCLVIGWNNGINVLYGQQALGLFNCISAKNSGTGITSSGSSGVTGYFYNNISVGNTTNWGAVTGFTGASNNAGVSGNSPWVTGGGSTITLATTDFASWGSSSWATTDDYSPALITSPQVNTGTLYYGILETDITDYDVPAYNNGGAETVDAGCYEFDLGYGPHPQTQAVSVSGLATGTRVKITKQSDGTELFNDVESSGSISYTEDLIVSTPVYVYLRKSSAAPFYHPTRLSATIDPEIGLSLSASGLQIEDIAAGTYAAGVATDWSINTSTGAITHTTGSTRYTVRDLYSYHQDYMDDSTRVNLGPFMYGITPTQFELINSGDITDADMEDLKGGSIEFPDGDLWSNVYNVGTLTGTPTIYVYQGTTKLNTFWSAGDIDILVKTKNAGTLISSGLVTGYARKWGYTYDHYESDLSAGGRNVMPLTTIADTGIVDTTTTVGAWSDITFTFGSTSKDFGDGDGPQTYYLVIDCNNRPLSEVYQRAQYVCREGATGTLNGVAAETYQRANSAYAVNKQAPFGTYSGGIWTLAQGIWLDNVASSDLVNYIITDHAGNTHQNTVAINQSVTINGVIVGSRVQIYDTTNSSELKNEVAATSTVYWEDPSSPTGDRAIRVRVSYVNGTTAKEFIEANIGTCGTTSQTKDVTYLVSQVDDDVYISNAIDGSGVTGITFTDAATDLVNISIPGGTVTWKTIYAAFVYWIDTALGIADDIAYIEAIDPANYLLTSMKLKNTSSLSVPLTVTGGYARDSSSGSIVDIIDTSGGNIYPLVDHVVSSVVTVGGTNIITGDIADVPTASEIKDAIISAAETLTVGKFLGLK